MEAWVCPDDFETVQPGDLEYDEIPIRRDGLHWPHRDGLRWPHLPSGFCSACHS